MLLLSSLLSCPMEKRRTWEELSQEEPASQESSLASHDYVLDDSTQPHHKLLFPYKLMQLLQDAEKTGNEDIVSWLAHGRAFKVHKPTEFEEGLMRKHFRQTRFKSFTRQLYHYGFGKIDSGRDRGAFHHPNFRRDNPSLCLLIERRKRTSSECSLQQEGGFYHNISGAVAGRGVQNAMLPSSFNALVGNRQLDGKPCSPMTDGVPSSANKPFAFGFSKKTHDQPTFAPEASVEFNEVRNYPLQQRDGIMGASADGEWFSSIEQVFCSSNSEGSNRNKNNQTSLGDLIDLEPRPIEEMLRRKDL